MAETSDQTHNELRESNESANEHVYRVISRSDWESAQHLGAVQMSGLDERDGFIHLSTKRAALETANLYFKPTDEPIVLKLSTRALGSSLRWEVVESRGGHRFPHLYESELPLSAVRCLIQLEMSAGRLTWGTESNT